MYADTKYHQISLLFLECTEMYLLILHFKTTSKSKSTEILKSDNFVFKATDLYYKALGKLGKFSQPQFLSSKRKIMIPTSHTLWELNDINNENTSTNLTTVMHSSGIVESLPTLRKVV